MRFLVAQSSLYEFKAGFVRMVWGQRWWNRLRWWFIRAKFWIKIVMVKENNTKGITIVLTKDEYDRWRERHGKS